MCNMDRDSTKHNQLTLTINMYKVINSHDKDDDKFILISEFLFLLCSYSPRRLFQICD